MMCPAVTRTLRLLPLVYYKEEELEGERGRGRDEDIGSLGYVLLSAGVINFCGAVGPHRQGTFDSHYPQAPWPTVGNPVKARD